MLLHKEKKIYRVLEGTVFILLSAFYPQSSSLFNGLLAPSCLLIGRISYRNGIGIESKPEGHRPPAHPSNLLACNHSAIKEEAAGAAILPFTGCAIPPESQESSICKRLKGVKTIKY